MMTQAELWWSTGGAMLVAVLASLAEWRRTRRRDLDRVGWMPWTAIQLTALFAAAVFLILAVRA